MWHEALHIAQQDMLGATDEDQARWLGYKELELERDDRTAEVDRTGPEYGKGWNDGYWSIHTGKVPPDLDVEEQILVCRRSQRGSSDRP